MKNIMKHSSLLFLILLILSTCSEEEVYQRGYPSLYTLEINNANENGVVFVAEILNHENLNILEYGFLWSKKVNVEINQSEKKIITTNFSDGVFSSKIETALENGTEYYVRAYLITDEYTVYGNMLSFDSKGSIGPNLKKIEPNNGVWGDTIQLIGNNFSYLNTSNKVTFKSVEARVIESNDSIIKCIVPQVDNSVTLPVKVEVSKKASNSSVNFKINAPTIQSISTLTGTFRDEIIIKGTNFGKKSSYNKFYFGNIESPLEYVNNNTLKVFVPDNIEEKTTQHKITSNSLEFEYKDNFELTPPIIENINQLAVFIGDDIEITGKNFHPIKSKNLISFNTAFAEIESSSKSKITTKIPLGPYNKRKVKTSIQILSMKFEYDLEIELKDDWILVSDNVPFYKSELRTSNTVVANNEAYIIARKKSPFSDLDYNTYFLWKFNETDKTWTNQSIPFNVGSIQWGNLAADQTNLYLYQPNESKNFISYNTITQTWSTKSNFPGNNRGYITSFSVNNEVYYGMGINFDSYIPKDYSDLYKYNAETDTWTELNDTGLGDRTFSANFVIDNTVYLLGGAFTTGHVDCFAYDPLIDSWNKKADLNVSFNRNTAFSLQNRGYLVANNSVFIYDPNLNSWSKTAFIEDIEREGNFSFSLNKKGYIGSGEVQNNYNYLMFEYNPK
jgi:hypothetical protein